MHYPQMSFPTLRFSKTVAEIKAALKNRLQVVATKQEAVQKELAERCSKWDLNPEEVHAAGDDETAISTYSGKLVGAMAVMTHGKKQTMNALQQAQAEMDRIPELGRERARLILVVGDLERVASHLGDDKRVFDLPFVDLASLGF